MVINSINWHFQTLTPELYVRSLDDKIKNSQSSQCPKCLKVASCNDNSNFFLRERRSLPVFPALADAIRVYVDDPDLRRRHGANARKRGEDEFSIETMVQHYQDIYDELLNTSMELTPVNLGVRK